jgi:cyclophilin family peptidyl-prolyl cis-trans isomerase
MQQRFHASLFARTTGIAALSAVLLAALSACGGGGGGTPPASTVTSASIAASRYGSPAIVTMSGTNLDSSGLSVTSSGCKDMKRLTSSPLISTATTAYYTCTVSGTYSGSVMIKSNGATIASPTFTVPVPQVTMRVTNGQGVLGFIVITLKGDKVPLTVDNFLNYVNGSFYDNTIIHRVAKIDPSTYFVNQGGGYGATVNGVLPPHKATNDPIAIETAGGYNVQWSIAMANSGPGTVTSEFFFNAMDNSSTLKDGYSVFGNITAGIDVAQTILAAPATCTNNGLALTIDCLPQPDVTVTAAWQSQ